MEREEGREERSHWQVSDTLECNRSSVGKSAKVEDDVLGRVKSVNQIDET